MKTRFLRDVRPDKDIDPRKGLRILPEAVSLLAENGCEASVDIIGPVVGAPGEEERTAIRSLAERHAAMLFGDSLFVSAL